ncbi:hypothetical protein HaLaN_00711, partial [Haematococcus lacustris]
YPRIGNNDRVEPPKQPLTAGRPVKTLLSNRKVRNDFRAMMAGGTTCGKVESRSHRATAEAHYELVQQRHLHPASRLCLGAELELEICPGLADILLIPSDLLELAPVLEWP